MGVFGLDKEKWESVTCGWIEYKVMMQNEYLKRYYQIAMYIDTKNSRWAYTTH